jgi:hypothetical protein
MLAIYDQWLNMTFPYAHLRTRIAGTSSAVSSLQISTMDNQKAIILTLA